VGIGWPQNNGYYMIGSDAVIGWQNGTAYPFYLSTKNKDTSGVVNNDQLNVTDPSVTFVDGITTMYFTRLLSAGFNPITDPTQCVVLVSTHDTTAGLAYHTCNAKTTYVLNLVDGTGYRGGFNNPRKNTHGVLMLVGWGLFIPLGMIFARYGRGALPDGLWFKFHQFFMTMGILMTTAGFILSFLMVDKIYYNTAFHGQLGTAIMGLGYIQFLMGVFRPHKEEGEKATGARAVFEIVHPNTGRLLIVLSCINIFAGISTWWQPFANIIYAACCVAPLALIIIVAEVLGLSSERGSGASDDYVSL